jgi:hypothetical protein
LATTCEVSATLLELLPPSRIAAPSPKKSGIGSFLFGAGAGLSALAANLARSGLRGIGLALLAHDGVGRLDRSRDVVGRLQRRARPAAYSTISPASASEPLMKVERAMSV